MIKIIENYIQNIQFQARGTPLDFRALVWVYGLIPIFCASEHSTMPTLFSRIFCLLCLLCFVSKTVEIVTIDKTASKMNSFVF